MGSKKLHKRSFLGETAANALHPHPLEAGSATHPSHPGFFIKDELSDHRFLVDTGAFRSILPPSRGNNPTLQPSSAALVAANGTSIQTYGEQEVNIRLSGQTYSWTFIIADVRHPLLGADFLSHYSLVVDVARHRLLNTDTYTSVPLCISNVEENINLLSTDDTYSDIIKDFDDVFKPELRLSPGAAAKHGVQHFIKTTGPPVYSRYRRLRPDLHHIAKEAFTEMEKMGVCSKAATPWASPLHMTPKKDGTWRPCGDYRRLNLITEPDHYAMPNISDLTSSISTSRVFSKLDLLKGYFQVPVNPDDVPKTAITTPFGTYVFHYSTFGLRNSGATFQRMMDQIFGHLPYCKVYIDDILIASENHREHRVHLQSVLQLLHINGLVIRRDKCVFGASTIDFLGHDISGDGIRPLPSKVDAVNKFPKPTTVKQLQEFLGMINYYHRFIPNAADILSPLYRLSSSRQKELEGWTPAHEHSFLAAKKALAQAATLATPTSADKLYLVTDASNIAIGAVLERCNDGHRQPLGFFSRQLSAPQRNYSTFDRELLAVHAAIRHFRHMLEGTSYTICTDHKPLVTALSKHSDAWTSRQQRHLSTIAETCCTIEYLPGKQNAVADALSRVEISAIQLGIDYVELCAAQQSDPETDAAKSSITNLRWKTVNFGDVQLLCDTSTGRPRPFVPKSFRRKIFNMIHNLSHPSIRATVQLVTDKFVWHSMNKDITAWSRTCVHCQRSKIHRHTKSSLGQFSQPTRRFGHIHVDVVGPLPISEGNRYLFTIIDRSTRWPEAVPMEEASTMSCANALLNSWVSRFGLPEQMTSDRGSVFTSDIWSSLAKLLGVNLHYTTAYHPQANGMVERWHRTLKASLTARCSGSDWHTQLPWVLLGLRTMPKEGLNHSAAEMVYGQPLVVPGEFFPYDSTADQTQIDILRRTVRELAPCRPSKLNNTTSYIPADLSTCEYVFIREDAHKPPLSKPYRGPFRVLARTDKSYRVQLDNREDWISIDRLKPAYLDITSHNRDITTRSGRTSRPPLRFDMSHPNGGGM